ncbi:MAG: outer membrane beta-barrel protein [Bacteroidales bacterium]
MKLVFKSSFSIFCFFFFANSIIGQTSSLSGKVLESINGEPIQLATIRVYIISKDTILIKGGTSDSKGLFFIDNLPKNKYLVRFDCVGFKKKFQHIELKNSSKSPTNMGSIYLVENQINLQEATVVGRVPEVIVKQDTLEYNPAAFKLQPGSVVEDMLKRMSGVEIDTEGKIKVAGKEVKKIYVDGKEFFVNDPTVATKNFTTDMIDRIQVIDKKSDLSLLTGIDDGEEETVINLTIKKGMKKGWMGNLQAGGGKEVGDTNNGIRYESNALINRFFGDSQFSIIANGNNTNNMGSRDWGSGFSSQMGMKGGKGGGGNNSGITTSNLIGVNGAFALTDNLKIGGNIMFNHSDNFANQVSSRRNLLKDSVSFNNSRSVNNYNSDNFSTALKMEYKPDSSWTMIFTPTISINKSITNSNDSSQLLAGEVRDPINSTGKMSYNKNTGISLNSRLDISYEFEKKGRRMSVSVEGGHNEGDGSGTIYANTLYQRNDTSILQNQKILNNSANNSFRLYTTFVEPIGTNNFLQFAYSLKINDSHSDKYSYNKENGIDLEYTILDPKYSKSLDNAYINQQFGTSFQVVREKYGYTIGLDLTPSFSRSKTYLLDSIYSNRPSRSVINYAPNIEYTYQFDKSHNLRINYRGRSNQPSISQLDPTVNQSSATNITIGNPSLLPSFNNNLTIRYRSNNRETQRSLMSQIQCQYTVNSIINKTTYDEKGNRKTEYVNENGEWNSSIALMYNTPIGKSKFQLNSYSTGSYNNQIGYSSIVTSAPPIKNTANTLSLNENLGIIYRNDWLYSQLRGSVKYAKSNNSLATLSKNETMNSSISYNAQFSLPAGLSLSSDIKYAQNRGFTAGYNKSETIWNAELSKTLFQRKQGTIRLKIYDILRQQLNYSWTSNAQYIQDSRYNTLTSYFMVFFNYRFNSMGRGAKREEYKNHDGHGHGDGGGGFKGEGGGFRGEGGSF